MHFIMVVRTGEANQVYEPELIPFICFAYPLVLVALRL